MPSTPTRPYNCSTSVALCTYNGARYIQEQVESILRQTLPVDEIVICDDGSTDNTLQIVESLQTKTPTNIRIFRNETNLGICANFQKAVNLCNGDIIFLSDQDDIWLPQKTQMITEWFSKNPCKNVVFSDAYLINESGELISKDTLFERIGFAKKYREYFDDGCELSVFYYCNHATGATMALRKQYQFAQYCSPHILHDEVIALLSIQESSLGYISEPLVNYRIHSTQGMSIPASIEDSEKRFNEEHILNPTLHSTRTSRWSFPLSDNTQSYKEFLHIRIKNKLSAVGFLVPLFRIKQYKLLYNNRYTSFMHYDMVASAKHTLFRIGRKFHLPSYQK